MSQSPTSSGFPQGAFDRQDDSPDPGFYAMPRLVAHIDDAAIAALTRAYRGLLPAGGALLDLMSSWISHLPADIAYAHVTGLGMNGEELARNPRLDARVVQDLNAQTRLPFADRSFDAAMIAVSVQYLTQPVEVLADVLRTLKPGAPVAISFSNRCFPTKAVRIWRVMDDEDHGRLVVHYLHQAGFDALQAFELLPPGGPGDPLWLVVGRSPVPRADAATWTG
ncbi:class I SAM-dependent methyltransferase [Zavarzinia sp. CC-PAN008]|uniref:class I SAM-dependent methyltransferase n=1 Tax=Zavarzinia sp. CC-PAN008 TaxID=3243332 RepID=UPI003F7484D8